MEAINMPQFANNLLAQYAKNTARTIRMVKHIEGITEDICPVCYVQMDEIDRDDEIKTYPDSGPEVVRTNWIRYRCPSCGKVVLADKNFNPAVD